ncbi:hypothetical protein [Colwellia sp. MB02u-6]|jgi:hypothetical protein|nr:hypothetical protein [Colwellia sp. MB02u-6]
MSNWVSWLDQPESQDKELALILLGFKKFMTVEESRKLTESLQS